MEDQSYGIIPLRRHSDSWQIFLIQHLAGHWSFPKGHAEPGETGKQSAIRELSEETALAVARFLPHPPLLEHYSFRHQGKMIDKTVTYFLAEVAGEVRLQLSEVCAGDWFSFSAAQKQLTFPQAQSLCLQVEELVS